MTNTTCFELNFCHKNQSNKTTKILVNINLIHFKLNTEVFSIKTESLNCENTNFYIFHPISIKLKKGAHIGKITD